MPQRPIILMGYNLHTISNLTGIDKSNLSKYLRGTKSPTLRTLIKVSKALNIETADLVSSIEEMLPDNPQEEI